MADSARHIARVRAAHPMEPAVAVSAATERQVGARGQRGSGMGPGGAGREGTEGLPPHGARSGSQRRDGEANGSEGSRHVCRRLFGEGRLLWIGAGGVSDTREVSSCDLSKLSDTKLCVGGERV